MLKPKAEIQAKKELGTNRTSFTVWATWEGVDRPRTDGISCGYDQKLAERLSRAVDAGAVFYNPQIRTDVNGKTYVSSESRLYTRHLNKSLKEIGF